MELRAEQLAFGYRGQPVGRDVNLSVSPGQVLLAATSLAKVLSRSWAWRA